MPDHAEFREGLKGCAGKTGSVHYHTSGTDRNTSRNAFGLRLDGLLGRKMEAPYRMGDIFYTSAVYAFKAECDMPSVASIIGHNKTMEMFRNPEKFDLYERKKSRSVNSYFDELYFGEQREE